MPRGAIGGKLKPASEGQPSSFLVAALKDLLSGNLDRIQIVKGWLDGTGALQDPESAPSLSAFYDARVSEIPTPRWTAYKAKRFNIVMNPVVPRIRTERAYTSPIWDTPG